MSMFRQLVVATVKDMVRDRMTLFWFFAFPVIFIFIFGFIWSGIDGGPQSYDIGLVVKDSGPLGQGVKAAFESVPVFKLFTGSEEEELDALSRGHRVAVVVVPEMDMATLMAGTPTEVLIYYDASEQATARIMVSSISEILSEVERRMTGAAKLIETRPLTIQVEQFRSIDYLLPGILSMALMQLGLFGTFGFVELREKKIIRRLGATPLRRSMMLWAEVLIRLVMALVQCVVIVAVGTVFFHVRVVGNWLHILGTVILGAATFISLGYFLVSFARTNESAQGLIQVVQFPMMFMSGIFFPVELMPGFLRPIMSAIPLTYLGDALRHFMLRLPSEFGIERDLSILAVWLLVALFFAIKRFRWD